MNTRFIIGVAALLTLGMTACGESSKFANSVEGTWVGNTVTLAKSGPGKDKKDCNKPDKPCKGEKGDKPCKGEKGGQPGGPEGPAPGQQPGQPGQPCVAGGPGAPGAPFGQMTVTPTLAFVKDKSTNGGSFTYSGVYSVTQPVFAATVKVPFQATATVNVTAKGMWTADEDDEINVVVEPTSVTATVDPSSIVLAYSVLTDEPVAALDSLKTQLTPNIDQNFSNAVAQKVGKMKKFDDVKIVGNTMTLEMGDTDFTFTKQ